MSSQFNGLDVTQLKPTITSIYPSAYKVDIKKVYASVTIQLGTMKPNIHIKGLSRKNARVTDSFDTSLVTTSLQKLIGRLKRDKENIETAIVSRHSQLSGLLNHLKSCSPVPVCCSSTEVQGHEHH